MTQIILESTITCTECAYAKTEIMPTDAVSGFMRVKTVMPCYDQKPVIVAYFVLMAQSFVHRCNQVAKIAVDTQMFKRQKYRLNR